MAQMLQKPVFALPGCQRTSVNTLLCDTLGLAEFLFPEMIRGIFWGAFWGSEVFCILYGAQEIATVDPHSRLHEDGAALKWTTLVEELWKNKRGTKEEVAARTWGHVSQRRLTAPDFKILRERPVPSWPKLLQNNSLGQLFL